jgi:type I restriction enzyme R subunit
MTPEEKARQTIDRLLIEAGWVIQDYKHLNLAAGRGIALREVPLKSGVCDYLLLVDRQAVGVVEAKKEGTLLSGVAEQSGNYAANLPDFLKTTGSLPFIYESTGQETFFRDERDPEPRSRRVFTFHRPETLAECCGTRAHCGHGWRRCRPRTHSARPGCALVSSKPTPISKSLLPPPICAP